MRRRLGQQPLAKSKESGLGGLGFGYPWKGLFYLKPYKLKVSKVMESLSAVVAKATTRPS